MNKILKFLKIQSVIPFETLFGFWCMYAGVAGLFNFGIADNLFNSAIGSMLTTIFNIGYILAGAAMFFGIGLRKRNIEAFGLIIVATSLLIRTVGISWLVGLNPIIFNAYVFNSAFMVACAVRLVSLFNNKVLVEQTARVI